MILLTDRLCDESREDVFLVVFGDRSNDGRERGNIGQFVLLCQLRTQRVEVDISPRPAILGGLVVFDQGVGKICAAPQEALALWRKLDAFLLRRGDRRHRGRGHCIGSRLRRLRALVQTTKTASEEC